jgi:hypothetical protein
LLWTPETESKGESDLFWTPEPEFKEESDLRWTPEPGSKGVSDLLWTPPGASPMDSKSKSMRFLGDASTWHLACAAA